MGQVKTSVKQRVLTNIVVLAKMSENRDNLIISEISPFYQHRSVGQNRSFVGHCESSVNSAHLQGRHVLVITSCCKRWIMRWYQVWAWMSEFDEIIKDLVNMV